MFCLHFKVFFYKLYTKFLSIKALYYVYYDKLYFQIYAFDLFWRFNYHLTMPYWTSQAFLLLRLSEYTRFGIISRLFSLNDYTNMLIGRKHLVLYMFPVLNRIFDNETDDIFNINISIKTYNDSKGRDDYFEIFLFWKWWTLSIFKPLLKLEITFFQKIYRLFWYFVDFVTTSLPIFFIKYYLHEKYTRAIWPFFVKITWA